MITASSQRYPISLYAVAIQIGEHKFYGVEAIANAKTDEVIIGRDVLNQLIVTLDGLGEVTEVRL